MLPLYQDPFMKGLLVVLFLLVVGIVGFGFYQGWFHLSTDNADHKSNVKFSVDQDKIQEDEKKAKGKVQDFGQKVKEKTGTQTDKVKEPERQP
jgi:predicted negative regulator of RcsB-dependent stress response